MKPGRASWVSFSALLAGCNDCVIAWVCRWPGPQRPVITWRTADGTFCCCFLIQVVVRAKTRSSERGHQRREILRQHVAAAAAQAAGCAAPGSIWDAADIGSSATSS